MAATDLVGRRVKVIDNESWSSTYLIGKIGVIVEKNEYFSSDGRGYLRIKLDDDTPFFIHLLPDEIVLFGPNEM